MNQAGASVDAELVARYRALSSCQVSDALRQLGHRYVEMRGIRCLQLDVKVIGPAFTVSYRRHGEGQAIEYIADVPAGAVLVLANGGRTDCSVWGGQRSVGALQRGAAGTVVDGAYRDVPEHLALGYPVFGLAPTVVSSSGHAVPVAYGEEVDMAGLRVGHGDLIIGDASGVVAVQREHVVEVLDVAEETAAEEQRISSAVAEGADFASFRAQVRSGG